MIEAMKQALAALEFFRDTAICSADTDTAEEAVTSLREAIADVEKQEPVALPPVHFEKVADGIEIGYDMLGGVDIRLGGEFIYVHINYDYRYTHNAARKELAEQIVGLFTSPPPRQWLGLTLEQKHQLNDALNLQGRFAVIDAIEAKLRQKNT